METVLVTGGAGFIGSHTCKALTAAGFLPVAFDNLSKGHAEFVRWGPLVKGDILDCRRTRCGLCATPSARRHPFRRTRLCRGIDVAAACLLPSQCRWPRQRGRGDSHTSAWPRFLGSSRVRMATSQIGCRKRRRDSQFRAHARGVSPVNARHRSRVTGAGTSTPCRFVPARSFESSRTA